MKPDRPLRLALTANAVFSLSSGLLMLVQPALVAGWLGIHASFLLQAAGIVLVFFAGELIYQATRRRIATWRALLASFADFSWVIASIILILAFPEVFSSLGKILILAVAGMVFVFGAWQLWGAGRAHRISGTRDYRHCLIVETDAQAETMWQVVGDIANIKEYMPMLRESAIMDGKAPGVGAVRVCEDRGGRKWAEECTVFNPGHNFVVRFLSEAEDFPFPAKAMRGGWGVKPSSVGSQVMVWWELTPKNPLLAPVILPLLAFQADRDFPKIIQRMAAKTLGKSDKAHKRSNAGGVRKIMPGPC